MDFKLSEDIQAVLELSGETEEELASHIGVSRITLVNWIHHHNEASLSLAKDFYEYAYRKGIYLNKIKEQFYREDSIRENDVLLFHGAKTEIKGKIRTDASKKINDFGDGFYCGESLAQSAMFVAALPSSSLYMLKFNKSHLKCHEFFVDREWMLTIAYYRRRLSSYAESEIVQRLIRSVEEADYIVAPIADNRMFEIIDSFIDGEITDIQCQHCLSATDLGRQYVFRTSAAVSQIEVLEHCFLSEREKNGYLEERAQGFLMNQDKVKLARKLYRNQGKYIEEILK